MCYLINLVRFENFHNFSLENREMQTICSMQRSSIIFQTHKLPKYTSVALCVLIFFFLFLVRFLQGKQNKEHHPFSHAHFEQLQRNPV